MFVLKILADEYVENDENEESHKDEGEVFQIHFINNPIQYLY